MEFLKHFFRANEDGFVFKMYGSVHILMLLLFISGIILITKNNTLLKNDKSNSRFLKAMALILLIDQIILYSWQFASGYFRIEMSLPLYHCRIAVWMLAISILFDLKNLKSVSIFWAFMGSVMAMAIPDLYAFSFPHYTNFQFFLVHIILGWIIANVLVVEQFKLTTEDLRFALKFTNLYNIGLILINFLLVRQYPEVNYGYMFALPGSITILNNHLIHSLIMLFAFNLGIILIFKLFTFKYDERNIWEISKNLF